MKPKKMCFLIGGYIAGLAVARSFYKDSLKNEACVQEMTPCEGEEGAKKCTATHHAMISFFYDIAQMHKKCFHMIHTHCCKNANFCCKIKIGTIETECENENGCCRAKKEDEVIAGE